MIPCGTPIQGCCCPNVVSSLCAKVLKFCDYESSQSGEIDVLALINVAGRAVKAGEMCSLGMFLPPCRCNADTGNE